MKRTAIQHTKVKRLERALEIPHYAAVGILESLWHLAARETPAGNIGKLSNEDISDDLDWRSDATDLIEGLITSGWVDEHDQHRLIIHHWSEHCEDSVDMRIARAKMLYADGTPARGNRLSRDEREAYAQAVRTKLHRVHEDGTSSALPKPLSPSQSHSAPNTSELSKESSRRTGVRPEVLVDTWNSLCGFLPKVKTLSKARQRKIATRISEGMTQGDFANAVRRCASVGFLSGDNPRGWSATFDWLIANDNNINRVLEGDYGEVPVRLEPNGSDECETGGAPLEASPDVNSQCSSGESSSPFWGTNK